MHSIIVGTAGHIDHGKTSLVRALTGIEADRLPEEKRRGITIDLGFAELDLGDVHIGFVDVPGHERFVKNMLAGAHGIDAVALVIAADEGVMPQTREHFDIARLLQVKSGLVVITKTDAVEEELLELVRIEAEELVAGSFLEGAPMVATSARTGAGLEELKKVLYRIALESPARGSSTVARLPIDRAFTMRGFGTVVTGTLIAGEVTAGSDMELLPGGNPVRVRGVQTHNRAVERVRAGQRVAVNLGGVEAASIERGMVLAEAGRLQPTQIIDVEAEVLESAPRSLRSRQRVRLHLGTAEVLARLSVLEEAGEIAAGERGLAQLRLESPIIALPDERFIMRSYSPPQTIAGGRVLDAHATKYRGHERERARARLLALTEADSAARLLLFVESTGERGLRRSEAAMRTGWQDDVLNRAVAEATRRGMIDADGVYISRATFENLLERTIGAVEQHHNTDAISRGLARETLREQVFAHVAPEVFRRVLAHAAETGKLVIERELVRTGTHRLELPSADAKLQRRLEQVYQQAQLEPPTIDEALTKAQAGGSSSQRERATKLLRLSVEAKRLVRVRDDLLFDREALNGLIQDLRRYAAQHEPERIIDMGTFKDLARVSRKFAIPLLEYFDRERITRRAGDRRIIL